MADFFRLVAVFAACMLLNARLVDMQTTINFSVMLSRGTQSIIVEQDTSEVYAAVNLAEDVINSNSSVLRGDLLAHNEELNSECNRSISLNRFFDDITTQPTKRFLLGCGCSIATLPVAEISHFWDIIQLSYSSLAPVTDRLSFPYLYSLVPNALTYVDVIKGILNTYGWTRLVVITQLENEFVALSEALANNISDIRTETFHTYNNVSNISYTLFEDNSYRIYFLNMYEMHARRVLCTAYNKNLDIQYPRYVFILPGTYSPQWWNVSDSCKVEEIQAVLNYSLVIATFPVTKDQNASTDVQMTYREFVEMLADEYTNTFSPPFAYDALWALALAYNKTNLNSSSSNYMFTQAVAAQLNSINFTGITGPVTFVNGTRRETSPRVLQYRFNYNSNNSNPVLIGEVITVDGNLVLRCDNNCNDTTWPIIVPFDGTPLSDFKATLLPLFIYLYTFATFGIFLCISCAIVNFVLRNRKIIRLTSPKLNYLITLGCGLMLASTYFYAYPYPDYTVLYVFCYIRVYTQAIGYTLCFGTMCAKMGRVFFIFNNTSPNKKRRSIQDWQLLLVILALVGVDVVIITLSLGIDDYKPSADVYREDPSSTNEYGIQVNHQSLVCDSEYSLAWIFLLFFIKFLVQACAVFFTLRTRKVKIKALNDAKTVSIVIYVTSLLLTIMVIGAVSLRRYSNTDTAVFGTGLIVVPTVVLLLLFIPKWYNLYKDPEGKNIFEYNSTAGQTFASTLSPGISEQEYGKAIARIEELESRLSKHETVTPFMARKRVLSAAADMNMSLSSSTTALVNNRSNTYSAGPSITASLPPMSNMRSIVSMSSPKQPTPDPEKASAKTFNNQGAGLPTVLINEVDETTSDSLTTSTKF